MTLTRCYKSQRHMQYAVDKATFVEVRLFLRSRRNNILRRVLGITYEDTNHAIPIEHLSSRFILMPPSVKVVNTAYTFN